MEAFHLFPENTSTYGGEIDHLFYLILFFVAIGFFISLFVLIYPLFRYNSSRVDRAEHITGEKSKHFRWVLMALILLTLSDFVILGVEHGTWATIEETPVNPDVHVAVIGRQWNWIFIYPGKDGILYTSDDVVVDQMNSELHVPVNKNVVFDLKSKDVLHDFFVPNFRIKQDAVPGRTIKRWFNSTKEGKYELVCSQICGVLHSKMRNYIVVESQEKYDAYIKDLYEKNAPKIAVDTTAVTQSNTDTTNIK